MVSGGATKEGSVPKQEGLAKHYGGSEGKKKQNKSRWKKVSQCSTCKQNAKYQQRPPLINHDIPDQPWVKVGSDLFEYDGAQYCLVVDNYSKFPEMMRLGRESTSQAVIRALKSIFSRHGTGGGGHSTFFQVGVCGRDFRSVGLAN